MEKMYTIKLIIFSKNNRRFSAYDFLRKYLQLEIIKIE